MLISAGAKNDLNAIGMAVGADRVRGAMPHAVTARVHRAGTALVVLPVEAALEIVAELIAKSRASASSRWPPRRTSM